MNIDEKIAFDFLKSIGMGIPKYEPDGNIPPDYAFDDKFGIEVRRLNQNCFEGAENQGIEHVSIRIHKILESCFDSFDAKYVDKTYFVIIKYKRPISESYKVVKKEINISLQNFLDNPIVYPATFKISNKIFLQFIESKKKYNKLFKLGLKLDFNIGGRLTQLLVENVSFCVAEKSLKIKTYKSKYKKWWLLLVDHIGLDMSKEDFDEIDISFFSKGIFDKVLIINPSSLKEIFSY